MRYFGLIGKSLSHSFSPSFFKKKFENERIVDAKYNIIELDNIEKISSLKLENKLSGYNVTIPYKKDIIKYLDGLSDEAQTIGAVNTIKVVGDKWIGYNTDAIGFEKAIKPLLSEQHTAALILGTGGASLAIRYILEKLGLKVTFVTSSSNHHLKYDRLNKEIVESNTVIINATPLGMFPSEDSSPDIPYQYITSSHIMYDLVYNPAETIFLKKGREKGAMVQSGYEMLKTQAEASWAIWNSRQV